MEAVKIVLIMVFGIDMLFQKRCLDPSVEFCRSCRNFSKKFPFFSAVVRFSPEELFHWFINVKKIFSSHPLAQLHETENSELKYQNLSERQLFYTYA